MSSLPLKFCILLLLQIHIPMVKRKTETHVWGVVPGAIYFKKWSPDPKPEDAEQQQSRCSTTCDK